MSYVSIPQTVGAFDQVATEKLLNRARFNSFLTALFSFGVIVLCVASFIFEWWTLTTSNFIVKFYVTGRISQCDASGGSCSSVTIGQVNTGTGSTSSITAARIISLVVTAINLLNAVFAFLFAVGHSAYLARLVANVSPGGLRALEAPPHPFLERYHRQRRGPASLVTGGIIAAIIALAPYGALISQWINDQGAFTSDPAFQQRPGSAFFTVIVTIVAWFFVGFNARKADFHLTKALEHGQSNSAGLMINPGTVPLGMPVGGYAVPVQPAMQPYGAQPGYAPYAPPQGSQVPYGGGY